MSTIARRAAQLLSQACPTSHGRPCEQPDGIGTGERTEATEHPPWAPPDSEFPFATGTSTKGRVSESHLCVDCGMDTHPGVQNRAEVDIELKRHHELGLPEDAPLGAIIFGPETECYIVRDSIWKKAGMAPWGGCLCIGCLEKRIGRRLKSKDFPDHPFNDLPGTPRLMSRRK